MSRPHSAHVRKGVRWHKPESWGCGSVETLYSCWYRVTSWSVLWNEYHNITALSGTVEVFSSELSQIFHSLSRTGGNCLQAFGCLQKLIFFDLCNHGNRKSCGFPRIHMKAIWMWNVFESSGLLSFCYLDSQCYFWFSVKLCNNHWSLHYNYQYQT